MTITTLSTNVFEKLKDPLTAEIFTLIIKKLFEQHYFSLCEAQRAIDLVNPIGRAVLREKEVEASHCIDWIKMTEGLKDHLFTALARAMVYSMHCNSQEETDSNIEDAKEILKAILSKTATLPNNSGRYYDYNFKSSFREERPVTPDEPPVYETKAKRSLLRLGTWIK